MRGPARGLLWAWVVLSMLFLAYAASFILASLPAGPLVAGMSQGPGGGFSEGERYLFEPVKTPADARTLVEDRKNLSFNEGGSVLLLGNATPATLFPGPPEDARLVRALAWVEWNATRGGWDVPALGLQNVTEVALADVPTYDPETGNRTVANVTFSLARTPANASGFIAKPDASPEPHPALVPLDEVRGRLAQAVPSRVAYGALLVSLLGVVAPIAILIRTQRPRGAPGLGPIAVGERCPECGAPTSAGWTFCLRCGAMRREPPPKP